MDGMAGRKRLFWVLGILLLSAVVLLVGNERSARQRSRAAEMEAKVEGERQGAEFGTTRQHSEELTVYFEIQHAEEEPRPTFPPGDYHSNGWPPNSLLPSDRP